MPQDTTIILWVADLHSGSIWSVYPNETLPLLSGPRGPSALQEALHKHWLEVAEYTAQMKADMNAKLVIVHVGDGTEGKHHDTPELVSNYLTDHKTIHERLMRELMDITKPDKLLYVDGTPIHAGEDEYDLATILGAERFSPGCFTHPHLKRTLYGRLIYAAHHGPGAGKGTTRGNALRNRIKTLEYELTLAHQSVPAMVVTAHQHAPAHECIDFGDHQIDWFALPSWKLIDGYMGKIDPFAFSRIGSMLSIHTPHGITHEFLCIHVEQVKESELI